MIATTGANDIASIIETMKADRVFSACLPVDALIIVLSRGKRREVISQTKVSPPVAV